jgi:lysophospholipase L1-like esterase
MRLGKLTALGCLALSTSCGGSAILPPAPSPIPNAPSISCPANVALISRTGQPPPTASYDTPVAQDGQPPVNVVCTPASGAEFQNGTTTVTCEATDSLTRRASCTFAVAVTPIPRLEKTKFLAFGDSITEGKIGLWPTGIILPGNYAERLLTKLTARYQEQTITMVNEGQGGEAAGDAKWRLGPVLSQARPEVLLLIDGTNDVLAAQDGPAIASAADAIRNMIQQGKGRGARVFIATLPPLKQARSVSAGAEAAVPVLNARIKVIAAEENVPLVDLYAAVPSSQIGADGKHPTPQGHDTIATTFFNVIIATLETTPSALPQSFGPVRALR